MSDFLVLTQPARQKIHELIATCDEPGLAFRAKVIGGGCQGMQYAFELHEPESSDWEMAVDNAGDIFKVIMDPISGQYLEGSTIDFQQSLAGEQFVIHNPNATTTCSCGASFTDDA